MDPDALARRNRLFDLVHNCFGGETDVVAHVIEENTPGAKVSVRAIQAWLMPPGRVSSRNCPPWALKAVEDFVADPINQPRLQVMARRREEDIRRVTTPVEWADKVRREKAVEFATCEIEDESRTLRQWQEQLGKDSGRYIFALELRLRSAERELSDSVAAIHQAVHGSENFEDFKKAYLEAERGRRLQRFSVKEARKHIENASEEFASDDGVVERPALS
ncbi:hypothetical protein [Ramlibacter alkalitolerans]|uniref:KfrA N-terminal DNA-binding domain-containing protein n=1 Tax=Ramlibacter alkalitolerans TaxID=2039631 RepID=A0ABS1JME5_9BURK|nr:hypothetical protein [Ramlibacter alkalitolerans]MBL0425417.1 hypothetical protein [Ramlibacter alkalitolerans]